MQRDRLLSEATSDGGGSEAEWGHASDHDDDDDDDEVVAGEEDDKFDDDPLAATPGTTATRRARRHGFVSAEKLRVASGTPSPSTADPAEYQSEPVPPSGAPNASAASTAATAAPKPKSRLPSIKTPPWWGVVLRELHALGVSPKFGPRAVRFLTFTTVVYLLGYFEWKMSYALVLSILFFYHGFWTERERKRVFVERIEAQARKELDYTKLHNLPQWLTFPDVESAIWLNAYVEAVWPFMKMAIADSIRASLQPTLDHYRPTWLTYLGIDKLDMGTTPLQITGVKNYPTAKKMVMLDLNVKWHGNPHIVVGLGVDWATVPVELQDFVFDGTLRVCFTHLVDKWPCFGAITISFVGKPNVAFHLRAAKMELTAIPMASKWLETFIQDTLVWLMVFPTVIHIPILAGEQFTQQQDTAKASSGYGMLQVSLDRVVGARLKAPYIRMHVDGGASTEKVSSEVATWVAGEGAFMWQSQSFDLVISDPFTQRLLIAVKDRKWGKDAKLGSVEIPVSSMIAGTSDVQTKSIGGAELTFVLTWLPFRDGSGGSGGAGVSAGTPVSNGTPQSATASSQLDSIMDMDADARSRARRRSTLTFEESTASDTVRARRAGMLSAASLPSMPAVGANGSPIAAPGSSPDVLSSVRSPGFSGSTRSLGSPTPQRPVGALTLELHKGHNLMRMDRFGKSDPYLKVHVGKTVWTSKVIKRTLNPVWEQVATIMVFQIQGEKLTGDLYDQDVGSDDDFMGKFSIDIQEIVQREHISHQIFDLQDARHGKLELSFHWNAL